MRLPKIRPFRRAADIIAESAVLLRPPADMSVSQWAEKHRRLKNPGGGYSGPWRNSIAPYLIGPMDALSDPMVTLVAVQGPSQAGKTDVGLNWWGWTVHMRPTDMLLCQPDKALMQDFVIRRLEPLIEQHRVIKDRQLPEASADNIFLKKFKGMLSTHIWPVAAQFTQRPVPWGWLDDYDQFDDDIEGQGSALSLLEGRQTTFEGGEKTYVSSSPAREDGGGIEAVRKSGSDERFHWRCPGCHEYFSPEFDAHLRFDETGTPDDAEASAHLVCPHNGCIIEPSEKRGMLQSSLALPHRGWLQPHQTLSETGEVKGDRKPYLYRTFRIDGLMGFTSWGKLARAWRQAQLAWETRQDESDLRTFWNTKGGKNYRSQAAAEKPLDPKSLLARRESGWALGTVPAGVRVLTAAVDVQGNRFEVAVIGWGEGLESWVIDRFAVHTLDDGRTQIAPARYPEHWLALVNTVLLRRYPLASDPEATVPILSTAVDTGGEAGVAKNAESFWHAARQMGVDARRITLIKGGNNPKGRLLPSPSYLDAKAKGGPAKSSVKLWMPNVHAMKSIIDARLRRTDPGAGYIHLPADFREDWISELTAEEIQGGKWVKVRPRNETLDLMVYGYTALMRPPFAGTRTAMDWVPPAFRAPAQVARLQPAIAATAAKKETADPAAAPRAAMPRANAVRDAAQHPAAEDWTRAARRADWLEPTDSWL